MKAITIQKQMNSALVSKNYNKAFRLFNEMNVLRAAEGLEFLTMPNLEKRFNGKIS